MPQMFVVSSHVSLGMSLQGRAFSSIPGPVSEQCTVNVEVSREARKGGGRERESKRVKLHVTQ